MRGRAALSRWSRFSSLPGVGLGVWRLRISLVLGSVWCWGWGRLQLGNWSGLGRLPGLGCAPEFARHQSPGPPMDSQMIPAASAPDCDAAVTGGDRAAASPASPSPRRGAHAGRQGNQDGGTGRWRHHRAPASQPDCLLREECGDDSPSRMPLRQPAGPELTDQLLTFFSPVRKDWGGDEGECPAASETTSPIIPSTTTTFLLGYRVFWQLFSDTFF